MVSSFFGTAAIGRFGGGKRSKGIKLGSKAGWILMNPGATGFPHRLHVPTRQTVPLFFLAVWMFHYTNRALVTPMLMRVQPGSTASFSLGVVIAGWITLFLHGYFNAAYLTEFGTQYTTEWFSDPRFQIGLAIYIFGFTLNVHSDSILRNLRSPNPSPDEPRYKIPYGGGFKWLTCPQYFGEILSFTGFAIMVWNLGAVFVLAMTAGNLIPERFTPTNGSTRTLMTTRKTERRLSQGYSDTGIRNHCSAVAIADASGWYQIAELIARS